MKLFGISINKIDSDYVRNEIILKPSLYACFSNKAKSTQFHFFSLGRVHPQKKYVGFKILVDLFSDSGGCHWIEITIFNSIASLRIDTKYGRKEIECLLEKDYRKSTLRVAQ